MQPICSSNIDYSTPWGTNTPLYFVRLREAHENQRLTISTGSEAMSLVQLIVPTEVAHDTIAELGELGDVQFKDVRI